MDRRRAARPVSTDSIDCEASALFREEPCSRWRAAQAVRYRRRAPARAAPTHRCVRRVPAIRARRPAPRDRPAWLRARFDRDACNDRRTCRRRRGTAATGLPTSCAEPDQSSSIQPGGDEFLPPTFLIPSTLPVVRRARTGLLSWSDWRPTLLFVVRDRYCVE